MLYYTNLEEYLDGKRSDLERIAQANIPEKGIILQVLQSRPDQTRADHPTRYSITHATKQITLDYLGIHGDRHRGPAAFATGREKADYPKHTVIPSKRHVFAVSPYDCNVLSDLLQVDVTPALLGANLVIGREDGQDYSLTALPENTRLAIGKQGSTTPARPPLAMLIHYVQQQGCGVTGNALAETYHDVTLTRRFVQHTHDHRGIVCTIEYPVETPALISPGQNVFFKFPQAIAP